MANSFSNWFVPTLQAPLVSGAPIISNILINPQNNLQQFMVTIMNQEVSTAHGQDKNKIVEGFGASEPLTIADCTDVAEPTIIVKSEATDDWTDICVKEDFSMYNEDSHLGEKEWIDWTELNVKEEVTEDKEEDMKPLAEIWNSEKCLFEETGLDNTHKSDSNKNKEDCEQATNNNLKEFEGKKADKEDKPEGIEKFKCEYCSYKTNWRGNLTKHVISRHKASEEIQWFECAHCSYKGKTKEYLRYHLRSAHGMFAKWHNCSQCSFKAKAKCVLDKHIITAHTEDDKINWFQCDQCSYKGKLSVNLKKHKLNIHTKHEEIKWFKCEYCAYQTKHKKNLKFHMINRHTDYERIKWFKCEKCSHKVKAKQNLKIHMVKHHNENQASKPKYGTKDVPVLIGKRICWKRVPIILTTDNNEQST